MSKYKNWSKRREQEWEHDHIDDLRLIYWKNEDADGGNAFVSLKRYFDDADWTKGFDTKKEAEEFAREWLKNHPYPDGEEVYAEQQYCYKAKVLETDESDVDGEWMARIELQEDLPADGVDAGEETWIDVEDIDAAMSMDGHQRIKARDFAQRNKWIEGE